MSKIAKKSYFSSSLILPFYKTSDHWDLVLLGKYAQPTAAFKSGLPSSLDEPYLAGIIIAVCFSIIFSLFFDCTIKNSINKYNN